MAQWPPEAVTAVEVLTGLVLDLCEQLEASHRRITELEEDCASGTSATGAGLSYPLNGYKLGVATGINWKGISF